MKKLPSRGPRLHSMPAVMRGRQFKGGFEIGGSSYEFAYAPARASVVGRRLQLLGRLTIKDARGQTHKRENVRAVLVGTQGGIGVAPTRPGNQASNATASSNLPEVESTGATGFCGVMYLHFEPLAGNALGVAADLSRVQLNARLAPVNDVERSLQAGYSAIVDALYGSKINQTGATTAAGELNKLLSEN